MTDLDKMAEAARQRVATWIARSAAQHKRQLREAFARLAAPVKKGQR